MFSYSTSLLAKLVILYFSQPSFPLVDPIFLRDLIYLKFGLQNIKLEQCVNATTCLPTRPKMSTVLRGASASIYVDNAAYRSSIYDKFKLSPVEMESAGVALICHQQRVPHITLRALSDLAGGGSAESNEADTFLPVAAKNSVIAVVEFIKLLH